MNMYTNTKKSKKFILILVLLMLFTFCYPKNVNADTADDIVAAPAKIFWWIEQGVLKFLNNIFTSELYHLGGTAEVSKVVFTPENIIKGKFLLLNANIFNEVTAGYYDVDNDGDGVIDTSVANGRVSLRKIIAGWYYALRNFAILALLSVLVYVGIRMILSTIAQDKAKYKVMFKDWLVALCLVVLMHYIMITILDLSDKVTNALGGGENSNMYASLESEITGVLSTGEEDPPYEFVNSQGELLTIGDAYAKIIVFGGIIVYTFIFAVKYLKREFTIIFLILLGPVSCITYPIDKISDGKAQAYNKWFSEFLYQVIIQPFHLLLYIVLIGSASDLADANVIYALVCFAVMMPAEKFIKEMFGFKDKLGSPLGAFAGGALASQLMNKMKGGSSGGKSGGGDKVDKESTELPVKTKSPELPGSEGSGESDSQGGDRTVRASDNPAIEGAGREDSGDEAGETVGTIDTPELEEGQYGEDADETEGNIETTDAPELEDGENSENGAGVESEENTDNPSGIENASEKELNKFQKGKAAIKDRYNRKLLRKYGTVNPKELAKKRAWKMTKGVGKFAGRTVKKTITGATGVAGALLGAGIGAMFGQADKGAMIGAGLGAKVGGSVGKLGDKAASKVGEYAGEFYKGANDKSSSKEKYKKDASNVDRARRNIKTRNNGRVGTGEEVENELNRMYTLAKYGVSDSQMDEAVDDVAKYMKEENMSEDDALRTVGRSALLAQSLKTTDFTNSNTMQQMYDNVMAAYAKSNLSEEEKEKNVRRILAGAGAMKGVHNVALPTRKIPESFARQILKARGISKPSKQQLERAEQLHLKLKEKYDLNQIQQICNNMNFNDNVSETEFTRKVQIYVDYESNEKEMAQIVEFLGDKASDQERRQEFIERMEIQQMFKLSGESNRERVSAIRAYEKNNGNKNNREFAKKMIEGRVSKRELDEAYISDKNEASYYKELVNGNDEAIKNELEMHAKNRDKM